MLIGLHDAEKDPYTQKHKQRYKKSIFPNYALMKISAFHKIQGNTVEWWEPINNNMYDRVYSSKVFDFTPENPFLPPCTIRGGTGYRDIPINQTLPPEIDNVFPDYSIYPDCDFAIGFLTRGCPNNCPWCVVPKKEGKIKPYRIWEQVVRSDTNKLVLMDNNILACEHGIAQLESLIGSGYTIDLNQGMDARLVDDRKADILSRLDWIRFIRFSCDQKPQIKAILNAAALLSSRGVALSRLFVYLLVTKDIEDAAYRVEQLKQIGPITIYAQAEQNPRMGIMPNALQKEFAQRYIYGGKYRTENWNDYCTRKKLRSERKGEADEP